MKAKNTKELKEKIEATAKSEFDFEQHLFKKYPDLFHTGEDGQLPPQFQRCWNDCPTGWETLVDNLFGSIDQYIKYTTKLKTIQTRRSKLGCIEISGERFTHGLIDSLIHIKG